MSTSQLNVRYVADSLEVQKPEIFQVISSQLNNNNNFYYQYVVVITRLYNKSFRRFYCRYGNIFRRLTQWDLLQSPTDIKISNCKNIFLM